MTEPTSKALAEAVALLARRPKHNAKIHDPDDGSDIFYLGCQRCVALTLAQAELHPTPGRQAIEVAVKRLAEEP